MKKLLLSLVAFTAISSVQAAWMSVSFTGPGTNTVALTNGGWILDSIQVVPSGTNTTTKLFDFPYKVVNLTNDAYVVRQQYSTNIITTNITSTGVTNIFTNAVLYTRSITNDASTNALSPLFTVITPSGTVGTYTLGFPLTQGLTVSNDVTSTVLLNYRSQ